MKQGQLLSWVPGMRTVHDRSQLFQTFPIRSCQSQQLTGSKLAFVALTCGTSFLASRTLAFFKLRDGKMLQKSLRANTDLKDPSPCCPDQRIGPQLSGWTLHFCEQQAQTNLMKHQEPVLTTLMHKSSDTKVVYVINLGPKVQCERAQ